MGLEQDIDITAEQRKIVLALLKEHLPNTAAWVYGSRAKWTARPQSDLDMVVFAAPEQGAQVSNLRDAFEESNLPFRVDLFVWDAVPEQFRKHIEAEHVVLVTGEQDGRPKELGWTSPSPPTSRSLALAGETVNLRSLLVHTRDGEWGAANPDDGLVPVRVIRGTDFEPVRRGDLTTVPTRYLRAEHSARKALRPGDILIETAGGSKGRPTGRTLLIQARTLEGVEIPFTCASFARFLRVDGARVNAPYLYWFLQHLYQTGEMERHQVQHTGIARFQFTRFAEETQIPLPPLPEQRAIAHILGTLDDKIELNRRMNETLEEMARALFKSWFIDFDPVHAKATLKQHAANHSPRQGDSAKAQAIDTARSGITPPLRGSRQDKGVSPQASRWGDITRLYSPQTLQKAQALQQTQTDAEELIWHYLRNKQLDGYKFRRQQSIGPYIVDFVCLSRKVLIELDGGQQVERTAYDKQRDEFLREQGYRLLRFWNTEVFENCFGVLESIYTALRPHPPLEGGSKDASLSGREFPPPHQPTPSGLAAATPPQGGSDWTVERARAYLDSMDENIAALFPDRFEDSELGKIPEGWGVKRIEDIAERVAMGPFGSSIKVSTFVDEGIPVISGQHLNGTLLYDNEYRFITKEHAEKLKKANVQRGDVIFTHAGSIGQAACIPQTSQFERYVISQRQFYMRCDVSQISPLFIVHFFKTPEGQHKLLANTSSTGVPSISRPVTYLRSIKLCIPPKAVSARFNEIVGGFHLKAEWNTAESRALTALREALLPKLVSGELRVDVGGT